jgi:alkanesulfonate monooxygenase SsuD/methylene tetrahydromethanopterin reductase-like flavin-dependent oxidoreductase (luciferase family)
MKVGITLPQFRDEADSALDAARRAEALGIDGVFCFDHLWPMGQPDRPALSSGPLLGALAASTSTISVGTLVARIGLLPDEVLVGVLTSLSQISEGRLIAGIGTGDHLSRAENEAFGIPFESADERRRRMAVVAARLCDGGIPVWIGGGLPKTGWRSPGEDRWGTPYPR